MSKRGSRMILSAREAMPMPRGMHRRGLLSTSGPLHRYGSTGSFTQGRPEPAYDRRNTIPRKSVR
jgi:hypothetical protein